MTEPAGGSEKRHFTPDFLTELFRNPLDPGYADAAARKARDGEATGWPRRVTTGVTALTMIVLGLLLVVAYRQTMAEEPARTQARTTLIDQIQRRRVDTDAQQVRADSLRREVAALRDRELGDVEAARLRDLEAATGLAQVRGDGARVTLVDGETPIDPMTGLRDEKGRIQDSDLQQAANDLWAGGAEAIAVNGQRLTATSTIRQAGEAILVDFRPVASPYEILAIGPDDLAKDFRDSYSGRLLRALNSRYGISFDVTSVNDLTLAPAAEPNLRFVVPSTPPPDRSADPSSSGAGDLRPGVSGPDSSDGSASPADPNSTSSEGG
jgi:uncharacterized protein YlxW (UPF0749 family)